MNFKLAMILVEGFLAWPAAKKIDRSSSAPGAAPPTARPARTVHLLPAKQPCFFRLCVVVMCSLIGACHQAEIIAQPLQWIRYLPLPDNSQVTNAAGRQRMKYLAGCALDRNTAVRGEHEGKTYIFDGDMGLAPAWAEQAMSEAEQRWVSACLLARMNLFEVPVEISMRSQNSSAAIFRPDSDTLERFNLYEASFYGNLFVDPPQAWVCVPTENEQQKSQLQVQMRVCSIEDESNVGQTRCGFQFAGHCKNGSKQRANGEDYSEVIQVWLEAK